MKAPDKVWENLSKRLSRERRGFGTGLSIFFLVTALLGYLSISNTNPVTHLRPGYSPVSTQAEKQQKQETKTALNTEQSAIAFIFPDKSKLTQSRAGKLPSQAFANAAVLSAEPSVALIDVPATNSDDIIASEPLASVVDDYPNDAAGASAQKVQMNKPALLSPSEAPLPWSIESVTNSFARRKSRWQTELHFTPTISYRKLSENKSYLHNLPITNPAPSYSTLYSSVNSMVTHKPDFGFELGISEKYALTKKVRVKAGLQFNVNRYDIKAFMAPYSFATIALNNRTRIDSVRTLSNYSNVNNSSGLLNWLQNFSFQVSAPVGVELALKTTDKMQFGIATTVQPTYVLGDRAYLITTDYKSYTQAPWLLRRWNVNTAFETFVAYQSGKTRWQVGPQVRYQLLSSFISDYPVKENLFDFGLKIGMSLNNK